MDGLTLIGTDLTDFLVTDGMNFEVDGTAVIVVDNPEEAPSQWQYRVADVPYTDSNNNWFSAIALASGKEVATDLDEMVYLVGNQGTRGLGVFDKGEYFSFIGMIWRREDASLQVMIRLVTHFHVYICL